MFEKYNFSSNQVQKYWDKALRDFYLAKKAKELEIIFVFTYEAMLKISIAVCARNGLRVKASRGHHIELIEKAADILKYNKLKKIGNEMRTKRNSSLYNAGDVVSHKEIISYLEFCEELIIESDRYLFPDKLI